MRRGTDASSLLAPFYLLIPRLSLRRLLLVAAATITCLSPGVSFAQQRKLPQAAAATPPHSAAAIKPSQGQVPNYGMLPISFEANQGQADSRVKFLAHGAGYTLYLKGNDAEFSLQGNAKPKGRSESFNSRPPSPTELAKRNDPRSSLEPKSPGPSTLLRVKLEGANRNATVAGVDKLPGVANYYIGNHPKNWHTGIPTYARVKYHGVYPGIDLVYYGNQQQIEYDFAVAPGADPGRIRMDFSTSRGKKQSGLHKAAPRIDSNGDLVIETAAGEVRLRAPVVYQPADGTQDDPSQAGKRKYITARFAAESGRGIGFRISSYDHTRPLVIDPAMIFATTVIGGSQGNLVNGMGLDASDNAYVLGTIVPASGYHEVVVFGINPQGNSLLYTTTLGGTGDASAGGIAVDPAGNAYIDGVASAGFPTTSGAYQSSCGDQFCNGPFAVKLSPSGSVEYATYLGPSRGNARSVAIDASGDAYVTGIVNSTDLPLVNAFQAQFANSFIQKLDPTGSQLLYSSYFGITGTPTETSASKIAVDGTGSIYLLGNGPVPLKNPLEQGVGPMFLAKFTPDGSSLEYSTQLGGSNIQALDTAEGLALDSSGNIYVIGEANSEDFPVTMNAFKASCPEEAADACGFRQVFVLKLDPTGKSLLYSTLLGWGWAGSIAIDSSGNAWVTGYSASNYFPTIQSIELTFQQDTYSASNVPSFLMRLDPGGTPTFSTFFGADFSGVASTAVAVDNNGNAYIAGATGGADFPFVNPVTGNSATGGGLFIAKISTSAPGPVLSFSPRVEAPIELRDLSTSPMTINSITASSNIILYGGTCGSSLPPGGACTLIWGPVDPLHFGSGTITVSSNAPGSPQTFTVYNAFLPITTILFSPGPEFPAQLAGTISATQTVTLTNLDYYNSVLSINSIQVPYPSQLGGVYGVFTQTNDCPATLPAGLSCHIYVQYQPVAGTDGRVAGNINIDTSAGPLSVNLAAIRSSVSLAASARNIQFGTQYVGATSLARVVTFTNTDVQPVSVGGIAVTGPFTQTNNCTGPLAPHASCRVAVSFIPPNNGPYTGLLTVNSSGQGSPATVNLAGAGMVFADIGVSPYSLTIRSLLGSSGTQSVTLTNVSGSTVSLSAFSPTPSNFTQTNDCNGSLAPGATCTVNVTFTPTVIGNVDGSVTISFSGQGSPQIIPLTGIGNTPLQTFPTALDFGQQALNITSAPQNVSLSNQSATSVTINSINVSGDFQLASNVCPNPIQPYYACPLQITFTPSATGAATGTLTVSASDSSTPHTVPLSGTGAVIPQVSLSPLSLTFGTLQAGSTSPPQTVALANTGDAALTISGIAVSGDFAQTNNCGSSVAAGSGCTISVTFTPTLGGTRTGAITITDNAPGSPQTVGLSGTATAPTASLSPNPMTFPSRALNTTSSPQKEALTNTSITTGLTVSGVAITGDFAETNNCVGSTLATNATCYINVTFTPTAEGLRTGTLTITDNAPGSPHTVPLSGTGSSDFVIGMGYGSPSSETVTAGSAATYSIALEPVGGFNQTIVLDCAGAPTGATCTVSPRSVTLDGMSAQTATVTVTTHAASLAPPGPRGSPPPPGRLPMNEWWNALLLVMMMGTLTTVLRQRGRGVPLLGGAVMLAAIAMSCGGGGGGGGTTPTPGTPRGTYTLTVTGTSGSLSHQIGLQLTVK